MDVIGATYVVLLFLGSTSIDLFYERTGAEDDVGVEVATQLNCGSGNVEDRSLGFYSSDYSDAGSKSKEDEVSGSLIEGNDANVLKIAEAGTVVRLFF